MLPQIPRVTNKLIQDAQGQLSTFPFPPNLAGMLTKEQRQKIFQWVLETYAWPQIMERKPFEDIWDKMLKMAKATWSYTDMDIDEGTRLNRRRQSTILDSYGDPIDGKAAGSNVLTDRIRIADTVIYDAIDRLTNLTQFITYKEKVPVRYDMPTDTEYPYSNDVYSPESSLVKSANAWLGFNYRNQDIFRKSWATARHHYTYGVSFVAAEFQQKVEPVQRRQPDKSFAEMLELTEVGVTFEPISIRKLWLNWRLPVYRMDHQPCPFHFEEMPRFALNANKYDQALNPMGFSNLEDLNAGKDAYWLFSSTETESLQKSYMTTFGAKAAPLTQILEPQYSVELLWTFYPMLPIAFEQIPPSELNPQGGLEVHVVEQEVEDPETGETVKVPIPLKRFIMQTFGTSLVEGQQEIIRLQPNFYPHDRVPIFGSAHMPTLDDGAYSSAIGTILESHYSQICKSLVQFLENKDWCNDPPVEIVHNSPAMNKDINKVGARIPVLSQNDIKRREPFDTSNNTVQFLEYVREQAKVSSKATEAILGNAMGSRTSATEANNVFQTAMSGITTDVNLFTQDIHGGYAERVWEYTGYWVDPDVLRTITGSYGFAILPEHLQIRLGVVCDAGSQFIESIQRQQQIQYLLQAFPFGTTEINRAYLADELLREWRFKNVSRIVNDGGRDAQIQQANMEACMIYQGEYVPVDPEQDHNIAIKVLTSYLKDRESFWNKNPATVINGPKIVEQIQLHQLWAQFIMQQQQLMMQQQLMVGQPDVLQPMQNEGQQQAPAKAPGKMATTAGQQRQKTGR